MTRLDLDAIERLRRSLDAPDLESDRYAVGEPLGRGGMGTVYLAHDRLLERAVALKVLHVEDGSDAGIERMVREARTLARLEHPGIVPIHDLGRLPDGRVYVVMKQVRGERLDGRAGPGTPLSERLRLFLKVCETVAFAHAAGVLHRDLKPENVMVGEFGEVLILDWGIARWIGSAESLPPHDEHAHGVRATDTQPGTVMGTPAYMAPEQARGDVGAIDARTDVFGLGAMLWFLATGRPPGPGGVPPPKPLVSICARAMASVPAARYPSAAELAADVERHLAGARPLAHREGALERTGRFVRRYRVAIGLVLAYLAVRSILWGVTRR